jgi:hypothetical protein
MMGSAENRCKIECDKANHEIGVTRLLRDASGRPVVATYLRLTGQ